jgi:ATP-binding cassette subfamily B (MDR/TAP) protein 1
LISICLPVCQVGKVLFDGVDVRTLNVKWLRSQISYVGQEPALFAGRGSSCTSAYESDIIDGRLMYMTAWSADGVLGTIFENILNGNPGANDEAVTEAARAANIHDFIMTLPNQYRTLYAKKNVLVNALLRSDAFGCIAIRQCHG